MNRNNMLTLATDGSSGNRGMSGWAWVSEQGTYRAGTLASSSILVAELRAITEAIEANRSANRMCVLTDSQPALSLISETISTGIIRDRHGKPGAKNAAALLNRLHWLSRKHVITFEWIKGHAGHPLNSAADRLAVQARRCAQLGGNPGSMTAIYNRIVEETLGQTALAS
ncbi:hypothetical protein QN357_13875 [Cryobacterium sp. RTC2.1]|uniref:ribonuclease HI n=1 Tax=Cryobacterium sp. RTC2.1 TaxID=3048634 RepID=UPI002B22C0FE|nr:RNase H family protein [Cryobacterium sp. RTC2.1]MEB0004015.1 hypothetical protein [Cryobacterium sp. RTC2.1]